MEEVKMSRLFKKTLVLMIVLFGVIATATSMVSSWNLFRQLTREYQSKGAAIAKSIADSSVEVLLNGDAATVQSILDQFDEIDGVAYVFVTDNAGEIISHTFVPSVPEEVKKFEAEARRSREGELTITSLTRAGMGNILDIGAPILAGAAGYAHVGMDRDLIRRQIWSAVVAQQGLMFVIFLMTILVAYFLVNRISRPLNLLAEHARTLATKDFSIGLNIPAQIDELSSRSKDEIGNLAGSFVYMERTLQQYVANLRETTAAKERIESELKIAHDIQMSMVPKTFPPFPHRSEFALFATLDPAREVGGDFYDFFFIDEDHLCFAIGDVSGKGVPAALFMAVTKTLLKATAHGKSKPDEVLAHLNDELCRDNTSCMFVTLFNAILNVRTGQLEYSNGGHNLPYRISNGRVQSLENTKGMVLGALEGASFDRNGVALQPGDSIVLYTDGVTEAMDERQNLFSEHRLEKFLTAVNRHSPEELTRGLVNEVRRFSAGTTQSDDITILVLKFCGSENHG